ncbi:hypothetical protein [Actinokineospora sp. HUAS TT18]|uniref:hypothetical protein n=1 Tax=Actinokineospora sp. HUAS TT18 TaxID=3447451 RepID=UPI003F5207CA
MRLRVLAVALLVAGCSTPAPAAQPVTPVDLPATPVALAVDGSALLIGMRRDGQPLVPALTRRADGKLTDIPLQGASPYGLLATWQSIAVDNGAYVAIGGERGGAHGNVRWSAWSGSAAGVTEKPQAFSTFGGWGAGDLIDAVITPQGPVLVGSWESKRTGLDVAVWTADGDSWNRQSSAGTPLESAADALGFATAATGFGQGVLIVGWQLGERIMPVVWRSTSGATGWTKTPLPDAGSTGTAMSVRCWAATCAAVGQVDGKLAVWELRDDRWTRLGGEPAVPVSDKDKLAPPVERDGRPAVVIADNGKIRLITRESTGWRDTEISGPTGAVTATAQLGGAIYLIADQRLWEARL